MVYPLHIYLNFQTNVSTRNCESEMSSPMDIAITNICIRDIVGISSFHSATAPYSLVSLTAPSDPGCLLGSLAAPSDPGCHCLLCGTLHDCDVPLVSRSHRHAPRCGGSRRCPLRRRRRRRRQRQGRGRRAGRQRAGRGPRPAAWPAAAEVDRNF